MITGAPATAPGAHRLDPRLLLAAALAIGALAILALLRGGLLGLPPAPGGVTAQSAGLADLKALAERARMLDRLAGGAGAASVAQTQSSDDASLARSADGLRAIARHEIAPGLESLRAAVRLAPQDLVVGNAYRMAVFRLRRDALAAVSRQSLAAKMPSELEGQPIAFLESVRREHPSRETSLQLALAWVDELMLFGALEIKAPASVQSVTLLSEILAKEPSYVPALYGRGLNYLHRPARLVWPESKKSAPDAASRDLGLCISIGRKIGGASPTLVATLALALGDAYAKEGKAERARSWWQIAANSTGDRDVRDAIGRRFGFRDAEMIDRLEEELQGRMLDFDHPLTDLAVMWR